MEKNLKLEDKVLEIITHARTNETAAELIAEYIDENYQTKNLLSYDDITDKLEPYVNDKVKSFWKDKYEISEAGGNNTAFMGMTVERTPSATPEQMKQGALAEEYQVFASFINQAADRGIIYGGVYLYPFKMELARISPSIRFMLIMYAKTKIPLIELRKISNLFISEGELPHRMEDIKFD